MIPHDMEGGRKGGEAEEEGGEREGSGLDMDIRSTRGERESERERGQKGFFQTSKRRF